MADYILLNCLCNPVASFFGIYLSGSELQLKFISVVESSTFPFPGIRQIPVCVNQEHAWCSYVCVQLPRWDCIHHYYLAQLSRYKSPKSVSILYTMNGNTKWESPVKKSIPSKPLYTPYLYQSRYKLKHYYHVLASYRCFNIIYREN